MFFNEEREKKNTVEKKKKACIKESNGNKILYTQTESENLSIESTQSMNLGKIILKQSCSGKKDIHLTETDSSLVTKRPTGLVNGTASSLRQGGGGSSLILRLVIIFVKFIP